MGNTLRRNTGSRMRPSPFCPHRRRPAIHRCHAPPVTTRRSVPGRVPSAWRRDRHREHLVPLHFRRLLKGAVRPRRRLQLHVHVLIESQSDSHAQVSRSELELWASNMLSNHLYPATRLIRKANRKVFRNRRTEEGLTLQKNALRILASRDKTHVFRLLYAFAPAPFLHSEGIQCVLYAPQASSFP